MSEDQYNDNDMFALSPEFAHILATLSPRELMDNYGPDALLIARFIQGRERRELESPTQEEIVKVVEYYHRFVADQHLLSLTFKGFAYMDWDPTTDEPVWQITAEGAAAVGLKGSRLEGSQ